MSRLALIICDCPTRSASVISALESEHGIWHVARIRDAIAFMCHQHPDTIVIDLDMSGLDAVELLDAIDARAGIQRSLIIGICKAPNLLAEPVEKRLDQIVSAPTPQAMHAAKKRPGCV